MCSVTCIARTNITETVLQFALCITHLFYAKHDTDLLNILLRYHQSYISQSVYIVYLPVCPFAERQHTQKEGQGIKQQQPCWSL